MKKIIFVELLHHHECIENPYLEYKDKGYQTKAILGDFVFNQLKNISEFRDEFYILNQPIRSLFPKNNIFKKVLYIYNEFIEIYKNTKQLKLIIKNEKPDYIYLNTIESPFLIPLIIYLLRLKNIKVILAIHNTNRLKVGFLKYFLFDFLIIKLIKKSFKIILLGKYLKFDDNKIQSKVQYFNNRIIINHNFKKFDKKTFVMSGSLNYKDKDYESVLLGFSKFFLKNPDYKYKVQLVLLGKLNDKVENWIKMYKLTNVVKTFDHYVGEKDMEKYMGGAHYSIISTYKGSIYGKYKISGSFGDAIGFGLPIILSENYAPDYIDKNIIRFKNNKLCEILGKLIKKE